MNDRKTILDVELPIPESVELALLAARMGVSTQKYLGYHVLRAAYGPLHPDVAEFYAAHIGACGD